MSGAEPASEPKRVSSNAISRVVALRDAEVAAARQMFLTGYHDWFYDYTEKGKHHPFHENFEDIIIGRPFEEIAFSAKRMAAIDSLHLAQGQTYSDFFVESGGGSWHEAVIDDPQSPENLHANPRARMAAISRSNVLKAYALLKAGAFAK